MRALGCGVQFGCSFGSSGGINVSLDYTSTVFAEYDVINERGDCLGWYAPKNDEFALQVVLRFLDRFALSTRGRVLNSFLVPEWVLAVMPELGIDGGGSGLALLDDIGFSYWLTDAVAVEAQCVGSGSTIDYFPAVDGAEPLPALARLSGRGTFWRRSPVRTSAFLELAKPLNRVRQFALSDFHVSVGGEVVAWDIVAANLSYFRDFLDGRSTLGLGLSLGYKNWIRLGYSRILPLGGSLGSGHQGNLSVSMPLKW
jgi:hypothetical protein